MNLAWMLAIACSGQTQYREACRKSAEASIHQTGLYSFMEKVEYSASKRARIELEQADLIEVAGATAFVYKTIKDKNIGYTIKKPGVLSADSMGVNAGLKGAGLGLTWTLD